MTVIMSKISKGQTSKIIILKCLNCLIHDKKISTYCMAYTTVMKHYFIYIMATSECIYAFLESLISIPHNSLSKPLAAFPYNSNYHQNNDQRLKRNKSCHDNYHKSVDRN